MSVNILYLGMAHDIESPLQLVDDFDVIYTMNIVDFRYGGRNITSKTIMELIKLTLETGKNFYSMPDKIKHLNLYERKPITKNIDIITPAKVISEAFYDSDGKEITYAEICPPERQYDENGELIEYDEHGNYAAFSDSQRIKWVLIFEYNGKPRKLVYYFGYNFEYDWPEDIRDISHIMMQVSYSFPNFRDIQFYYNWNNACEANIDYVYNESMTPHTELIELIESRTTMPLTFYDGSSYFKDKKTVKRCMGFEEDCEEDISYVTFEAPLNLDWWRNTLPFSISVSS